MWSKEHTAIFRMPAPKPIQCSENGHGCRFLKTFPVQMTEIFSQIDNSNYRVENSSIIGFDF